MTQQIAIHGKGGVGKSALASNLAAALAEMGHEVVVVGCGPRGDSTAMLIAEEPRTVIDLLMSGQRPTLGQIVNKGFGGISCIELGDPFLLDKCASSGIGRAVALLRELNAHGELNRDFVLYDIPGEAGCSGFSGIAASEVETALVVTSADVLSLFAANSLFNMLARQNGARRVALVANGLNGPLEEAIVDDFARQVNSRVLGHIPRSLVVKQCELYGKTVIEAAPLSNHSFAYRRLARHILDNRPNSSPPVPRPLSAGVLKAWASGWGDRIYELEHGLIRDGAGI